MGESVFSKYMTRPAGYLMFFFCGILAGVWVFHILYFIFGVKTLEEPPAG